LALFQHFFLGIYFLNQSANRSHLLRVKRITFILLVPLCLLGCFGNKQNLIYETFKRGIENPNTTIEQTKLDPRYRYLKVDVNNLPALLVLGYEESFPNGVVSTWYSAYKEVFQIQNGRLINTQGLELNWTDVSLTDAPSLTKVAMMGTTMGSKKNSALRYQRVRTVMPSYRANIEETVEIKLLEIVPSDAPKILQQGNDAQFIRWIEESVLMQTNIRTPFLDPVRAIYAINTKTSQVIYGRQCLAAQFCVSWLDWPYPSTPITEPLMAPSK
jgi:hypothetical protein